MVGESGRHLGVRKLSPTGCLTDETRPYRLPGRRRPCNIWTRRNGRLLDDLVEIVKAPSRVPGLPKASNPALLGELEHLKASLWGQMVEAGARTGEPQDSLLAIEEAAEKLAVTHDWLYRHHDDLPFTRRLGPKQLRFSERGIQEYLRRRGRTR